MSTTLTKNSFVKYGTSGVCRISDISGEGFKNGKTYYILEPVGNSKSKIFVPTDNENLVTKMKTVLSREEIDTLLDECKDKHDEWIDDKYLRKERLQSVICGSDRYELIMAIRCLYEKKAELAKRGKRLSSTDENYLKQAEQLIENEFAYALDIKGSQVTKYIEEKLRIEDVQVDEDAEPEEE